MPSSFLLAAALFLFAPSPGDLAPGDALQLADQPVPTLAPLPSPGSDPPSSPGGSLTTSAALAALGALAAATAVAGGLRRPRREGDPIYVLVPGYGSYSAEEVFGELIDLMDLGPDDVAFFDYRMASPTPVHVWASRRATMENLAAALHGFISGLTAGTDRPVYAIGHSKGGAAIAEVIARWDDGIAVPDGVIGASILDAPMATGPHGLLQSLGSFLGGALPNDGGYNPKECLVGPFWCEDDRTHLGRASGVPVSVILNPKAGITNFADGPEGLRVYAAADEGPGFWGALLQPWSFPGRVGDAHDSVLGDRRVAECILAEAAAPGSCDLPAANRSFAELAHRPGKAFGVLVPTIL